jgi:tetrapyrrole methylase family protein / MazG family protein
MIDIVGLGPGDLARVPPSTRELLSDHARTVIVRTLHHPAASQLAELRPVVSCDDIYEAADTFDQVYDAIADRVLAASDPIYAVPGSPMVGEFAVAKIRRRTPHVTVHPAESFLDAVFAHFGVDPLADGFQLLNGHELPSVLGFDVPTVIGHLDRPEILADLAARLDRALPEDAVVSLVCSLGAEDEVIVTASPERLDPALAGLRTSVFVPSTDGGVVGAIHTMRRLRRECPWDRNQTHHSLVRHLLEETAELADAIAGLSPGAHEPGAYAEVEEELGDVLLQVLFHAAIAEQEGAFDITDVAETLRRKLVRRHPHVFGDVDAGDAATVRANWDAIKAAEKGEWGHSSAVGGIPAGLDALARAAELQRRAAAVGFDWPEVHPVLAKVGEELGELTEAIAEDDQSSVRAEFGDLLFSVVNLARHVGVEPDTALRAANHRFEARFRVMESDGPLADLSLDELDARWERAKTRTQG